MRFKIDYMHAVPSVAMRIAPLDTDKPADLATVDGLNGWTELLRLYKEQSADAGEWRRAFEQCATGLYEAERLASCSDSNPRTSPLDDDGAACLAVGAFLQGLFSAA